MTRFRGSIDLGGGEPVAPIDPLAPILSRHDLAGAHLGDTVFTDAEESRIWALQRGPADGFVFAGDIDGEAVLGAGPRVAVDDSDTLVHRRAP